MRSPASVTLLLALASCLIPIARAQQSAPSAPGPACTLQGKVYTCSKPALQQALASARTVAIVSQPANHASDAALASLAKSLGKTVASGDEAHPADLSLRLTPIEPAGVSVGLSTTDLAMLNIFVAAPGNPTSRLLWSETYNGNPDMPWPSVTRALTRQFLSRLGRQ